MMPAISAQPPIPIAMASPIFEYALGLDPKNVSDALRLARSRHRLNGSAHPDLHADQKRHRHQAAHLKSPPISSTWDFRLRP